MTFQQRIDAARSWFLWGGSLSVYSAAALTYGTMVYRRSAAHFEDIVADRGGVSHALPLPTSSAVDADDAFERHYDPASDKASSYIKTLGAYWDPRHTNEDPGKRVKGSLVKRIFGYLLAVPGFILALIPALLMGLIGGKRKENLHGFHSLREFSWYAQRAFFFGLLKGLIYAIIYVIPVLTALQLMGTAVLALLPGVGVITGLFILGFAIYKSHQSFQAEKLIMDEVMSVAGPELNMETKRLHQYESKMKIHAADVAKKLPAESKADEKPEGDTKADAVKPQKHVFRLRQLFKELLSMSTEEPAKQLNVQHAMSECVSKNTRSKILEKVSTKTDVSAGFNDEGLARVPLQFRHHVEIDVSTKAVRSIPATLAP
ncbi:MAG: hypothetical protein V4490_01665 [Pseudomonadota bacterium]